MLSVMGGCGLHAVPPKTREQISKRRTLEIGETPLPPAGKEEYTLLQDPQAEHANSGFFKKEEMELLVAACAASEIGGETMMRSLLCNLYPYATQGVPISYEHRHVQSGGVVYLPNGMYPHLGKWCQGSARYVPFGVPYREDS